MQEAEGAPGTGVAVVGVDAFPVVDAAARGSHRHRHALVDHHLLHVARQAGHALQVVVEAVHPFGRKGRFFPSVMVQHVEPGAHVMHPRRIQVAAGDVGRLLAERGDARMQAGDARIGQQEGGIGGEVARPFGRMQRHIVTKFAERERGLAVQQRQAVAAVERAFQAPAQGGGQLAAALHRFGLRQVARQDLGQQLQFVVVRMRGAAPGASDLAEHGGVARGGAARLRRPIRRVLSAVRAEPFEGADRRQRAAVPGKFGGLRQAVFAQARALAGVAHQLRQPGADRCHRVRVEQRGGIADHFRDAGGVGADHRRAAGHRLEYRQAESFMARRKNEQLGQVVQHHQVIFRDVAGQHHVVGGEAGMADPLFQVGAFGAVDLADDDELVAGAQRRRQRAEGIDQAVEILAAVEAAGRIHQHGAADAEARAQLRHRFGRIAARLEMGRIDRGGDIHHPPGRQAQRRNGLAARVVGYRQQQVALPERGDLAIVVLAMDRGGQVDRRVEQRDQVVQDGHRAHAACRHADSGDGVVDVAFEQAGDEHHVGLQFGQEVSPHMLGRAGAPAVRRIVPGDRGGHAEHLDAARRHQRFERRADVGQAVGQGAVERQPDFVRAGVAGDRQRDRQRIAADATESAFALGALHVDQDAHQRPPSSTARLRSA